VRLLCFSALTALLIHPVSADGQGYRLRLDTRYQSVAIRGVTADSVAAGDVVVGAAGGFESPDGFAVRCISGSAFCSFFRPGPTRRGGPLVTTANLQLWGFGVPGLRVRASARVGTDVGDENVWPGTDPAVRLQYAYVEYTRSSLNAQLGRTYTTSRLGFTAFDGTRVDLRLLDRRLTTSAYGGWGLARAIALPLSSPALDPLDDAQPRRRQAVAGAAVTLATSLLHAQLTYERQWDPGSEAVVSERAGLETQILTSFGLTLAGGGDYDLSYGYTGNAEGRVSYNTFGGRAHLTAGARRYRPHFDLWTIWGAFSSVPYHALFTRAFVSPVPELQLRFRGEAYEFDETDAITPLVDEENGGWRWSVGSTFAVSPELNVSADFHRELGPGAASSGFEAAIMVNPLDEFEFSVFGGRLERPLEFRFNEAKLWNYGVAVTFEPTPALRFNGGIQGYHEDRIRPDAAAFDWDQIRISLGATLVWGSHTAGTRIPPSIMRIPTRKVGS